MYFELTDKHIQSKRLSEADFSEVAGFPVPLLEFWDYPHAGELFKYRYLSPHDLGQRGREIFDTLKARGLAEPTGAFKWKHAKTAASCITSIHYQPLHNTDTHSRADHRHFIQSTNEANPSLLWDMNQIGPFFAPLNLSRDKREDIDNPQSIFVLLNQQLTRVQYWSLMTDIPEALIENYPHEDYHALSLGLHELAHVEHIQSDLKGAAAEFEEDMAADMGIITSFRKAGIGHETLQANIHARYLGMLSSPSNYWFAASLEAVLKQGQPKDPEATFLAVHEIRVRLAMRMAGKASLLTPSSDLQRSIQRWSDYPLNEPKIRGLMYEYYNSICPSTSKDPSRVHTTLHQLVDSRVFTDSFAEHLAVKIVEAAKYFNPELIAADTTSNRKQMDERMGTLRHLRQIAASFNPWMR